MNLRDDRGVTLTELVVVTVLMLFMLATTYMMFNAGTTVADAAASRAAASDGAQRAFETVSRDLRQAQENIEYKGVFSSIASNSIEFYMDERPVGGTRNGKPDMIKYYVSGTTLYRAVAAPTNNVSPYTYGAYGPSVAVLKNLAMGTVPVFCFHSTTVNSTVVCGNGSKHGYAVVTTTDPLNHATKVALVGVTLINQERSGARTSKVTTTGLIRIRSVENVVK
jgi:Tfp pilus assembly protein PilW